MTTANFSRILAPHSGLSFGGTPSFSNHLVDASNEGVAFVFDAKSANAITHLGFRYGARALTPPTYIIGLEGVSASTGFPDGTYKGGGSPASATFTPPASAAWDGTWQWIALTNSYTPTLSERLAITIRYSSGTIDATNNSSFSTTVTNGAPALPMFPYALRNTSGTWAVQGTGGGVFGVRTASERYGAIFPNLYQTRSASTVGLRQAALINLPGGFGDTYKLAGFRAVMSIAQATGRAPQAKIWSASSALASKTLDSDQVGATASGAFRTCEVIFESSVTLNFGTDYYVGLEVADAVSGGVLMYGTQFASSGDNLDDGGSIVQFATHNGTSWTTDGTVRPWIELIVEDWTEPASSGGLVAPIVSGSGGLIIR